MRVKLSKLLSAVLAICIVFVGFTAFAADPATVVTTTNYEYLANNDGNDGIPANAKLTVETKVTGVAAGTEVTYLVSKGTSSSDIFYINQDTAGANGVTFTFTADQGNLFNVNTIAKYGSDGGYTMPTFQFNHGVNYMSNGSALVTKDTNVWGADLDDGKVFLGKVSGDVSVYGVKIGDVEYPAMGCDDEGNFAILIEGIDTTGAVEFAR